MQRTLKQYMLIYCGMLATFLVLDGLRLGYIAYDLYQTQLSHLLSQQILRGAAAGFYAMYLIGLMIFSVIPGLQKNSLRYTLIYGALFGFFTYATYDMTNLATLQDWPMIVVVVDTLWGTVLCTLVSWSGFIIGKHISH